MPVVRNEGVWWERKANKATKVVRSLLGRLAGSEELLTEMTVSRGSLHNQLPNHQVAATSEISIDGAASYSGPCDCPCDVGKVDGLVGSMSAWGKVNPEDLADRLVAASAADAKETVWLLPNVRHEVNMDNEVGDGTASEPAVKKARGKTKRSYIENNI